ncbi:MAG: hypothetical protein R3266_09680, partial [Gemmatimonadota bacterium]|nr:hypothetical protein [Gemmatimonadota bacterium]
MSPDPRCALSIVLLASLGLLALGQGASAQELEDAQEQAPITVAPGSGSFTLPGGTHPERTITVHYHRP